MEDPGKMKRRALAFGAGLLLLGLLPGFALAAPVVDQKSETVSYVWGGSGVANYAQTFTVGMAGKLTGVDLNLQGVEVATTVDVTIQSLNGSGFPNGTHLASGSATAPATTGWVHFALTPMISVTVGQVYAIVFTINGQPNAPWEVWGAITNPYAGGEAQDASSGWHGLQDVTTSDFAFRTYVDAAAKSAPPTGTAPVGGTDNSGSSLPLIAAGLAAAAALAIMRRYRLPSR
jgi:hypothetical protein